jgi:hypothetical protein
VGGRFPFKQLIFFIRRFGEKNTHKEITVFRNNEELILLHYHSGVTPPPPKGGPRGGSEPKNFKNLPAPPCLGEALRRETSQIMMDTLQDIRQYRVLEVSKKTIWEKRLLNK